MSAFVASTRVIGYQGTGAAGILDRQLGAIALANVVDRLDGAVAAIGHAGERLGDHVDGAVVVLGNGVDGDERVEQAGIDGMPAERLHHRVDVGPVEDDAALAIVDGDLDLHVAAIVDEQTAGEVRLVETVVQGNRGDPPVQLLLRILAVPVPDPGRPDGRAGQQVAAARHRHRVEQGMRGFADAGAGDRRGQELPVVVPVVQPLPRRDFRGVDPAPGRRRHAVGHGCVGRLPGARPFHRPAGIEGQAQPVRPVRAEDVVGVHGHAATVGASPRATISARRPRSRSRNRPTSACAFRRPASSLSATTDTASV